MLYSPRSNRPKLSSWILLSVLGGYFCIAFSLGDAHRREHAALLLSKILPVERTDGCDTESVESRSFCTCEHHKQKIAESPAPNESQKKYPCPLCAHENSVHCYFQTTVIAALSTQKTILCSPLALGVCETTSPRQIPIRGPPSKSFFA